MKSSSPSAVCMLFLSAQLVFGSTTPADHLLPTKAFPFPTQADHALAEFGSQLNTAGRKSQQSLDRMLSPTHSSLQEFCSKYTCIYEDSWGFDACECKDEEAATLCWYHRESNTTSFDHMFVFVAYDEVKGEASGGGYCQCGGSDCLTQFCMYVHDPVGTPTCSTYTGVLLQGFSCDTCRICNTTQSLISFQFDECGLGEFGCLQAPLFIFGADAPTDDLAIDHSPQPIAFPPIDVPTTAPPTTGPTMPPTRSGDDLLSIAIQDPQSTLYGGNSIASCSFPNQTAIPYRRSKMECLFNEPICVNDDCHDVWQLWDFDTIVGTLWSQSTCFGNDSICFHVAYDPDQSVAIDCSLHYQWNGKDCFECSICESQGRTGVQVNDCETKGLALNECNVDIFAGATPQIALDGSFSSPTGSGIRFGYCILLILLMMSFSPGKESGVTPSLV